MKIVETVALIDRQQITIFILMNDDQPVLASLDKQTCEDYLEYCV